ncbi:MAG: AAA family ATPase [Candidatus Gastranaerophilales bacterium]|nr:AAA family ATPase [Candidatus Gastranaerophilales bacterium]
MRKVFARTQNVKNFITMMNNLQHRAEGVPGMGLVYGEPGLGKTQAVLWWTLQNDAVYIRGANLMSGRWLLEELVEELGEVAYYKTSDLFKQVLRQLKQDPRTIIVDEIDYLTGDARTIETLRDIHDKTNVPIVLVGMGQADKKLMRYRHLYDRISEKLKFEAFTQNDIKTIIEQISEVEITECGIRYIFSHTNRFRQIVKLINKAENIAQANGLSIIDEITLKELVDNEAENIKAG